MKYIAQKSKYEYYYMNTLYQKVSFVCLEKDQMHCSQYEQNRFFPYKLKFVQLFLSENCLLSKSVLTFSSWLDQSVGCLRQVGLARLTVCVTDLKTPN